MLNKVKCDTCLGVTKWCITTTYMLLQMSVQSLFGKLTTVRWQDILAWKILWQYYKSISTGRNFDRTSTSISGSALPVLLPNQPLRSKACIPLCLLSKGHGNPSQWTTCRAFLQLSREMTVFLWWLIDFVRWLSSQPARRIS
jgi:hypothetical protein